MTARARHPAKPGTAPGTRLLAALALLALLAGCASQPGELSGNARDLRHLNHWQLEGKLGFRSPDRNGSAWLRWQQRDSAYYLRLNGPFGAASTEISGDEGVAVLRQSGREDISAASGEDLSAHLFGWPFPVAEMPHWVKGRPAPGSRATPEYDQLGLLTSLRQQGWQLEFSGYQVVGAWTLPTRIKGSRGDHGFTLVINTWTPESPVPEG